MTEHDKLVEDCARAIYENTGYRCPWKSLSAGEAAEFRRDACAVLAIAVERCALRADWERVEGSLWRDEDLVQDNTAKTIAAAATTGEPELKLEWRNGAPEKHWAKEWFIAETTYGDRVVLTALPEEYTYDFKTADDTYIKAEKIKRWMQFPDSEYSAPAPSTRETDEYTGHIKKLEEILGLARAYIDDASPDWHLAKLDMLSVIDANLAPAAPTTGETP